MSKRPKVVWCCVCDKPYAECICNPGKHVPVEIETDNDFEFPEQDDVDMYEDTNND